MKTIDGAVAKSFLYKLSLIFLKYYYFRLRVFDSHIKMVGTLKAKLRLYKVSLSSFHFLFTS